MEQILQTFEEPFRDSENRIYDVQLYGRSRPGSTWQGWLVFVRRSDQTRFATDVETTQPSAEAIVYWATGLTDAYFDGAFERARRGRRQRRTPAAPLPLRDGRTDQTTYLRRLTALENAILGVFTRRSISQLPTESLFDELPHAHADVVRALEDMEKQRRLLVRRTEAGRDLVILSEEGLHAAGLEGAKHRHEVVEPDRPKSTR